jgi:hypothetical protein
VPASLRFLAATLATSAAIVLPMAGQATAATAAPLRPMAPASPAAVAGLTGRPIVLQNNAEFSGYDMGVDAAGTAFVGWIGDSGSGRKVHLCTLPPGATSCRGGIQTISPPGPLGPSSAASLRVLVTPGGQVTLVFFHDTVASENGPNGSEITIATSRAGGPLSAAHDVATGPSFGTMLDAELGPNGSIWVVSEPSSGSILQLRPGLTSPAVTLHTPYGVQVAKLAFTGSTAVLAIQKDGAITVPVSFASERGGHWSGFRALARTWTSDANLGLVKTSAGIRLLASVSNADYFPVVSQWTGTGFTRPTQTGDHNNCSPSSHDPVADASGRMADVSEECTDVAIANLTDTLHAAVVRFNTHGTFAGGIPQLVTTPRGRGWVAWSIESTISNKLLVAPLLLPGRVVIRTARAGQDRVTLHGPASCLPPVNVGIGVSGSPARGGRVIRKVLRLNGRALGSTTLRGGTLVAGRRYTLTGSVTFSGGSRRTVTAQLTFRSCPGS